MGVWPTTRSQDSAYAHANAHRDCHAFRNRHADGQPNTNEYGYGNTDTDADQYCDHNPIAHEHGYGYCDINADKYAHSYTNATRYYHSDAHLHSHPCDHSGDGNAGSASTYADADNRGSYGNSADNYSFACRDYCAAARIEWRMRVRGGCAVRNGCC